MSPPPIRYPLPSLAALLLAALLAWKAEPWSRPVRSLLAARLERLAAAPPIPASPSPMLVAGPLVRRVLLLHDDMAATDAPDDRVTETIRLRQFCDVYDVWPASTNATHFRVGNRRPWGWVPAAGVLDWPTRLVLIAPTRSDAGNREARASGDVPAPRPILGYDADSSIRVATWDPGAAWRIVAGQEHLPGDQAGAWGIWLTREEWLAVIGLLGNAETSADLDEVRVRAVSGRLVADPPWSPDDVAKIRAWLPPAAFATRAASRELALEALARANEDWVAQATWSGLEFRTMPLSDLP